MEILDASSKLQVERNYFKVRVVILWFIPVVLYFIFKALHWSGGNILLIFGTAGFSAYLWSGLYFLKAKHSFNTALSILAAIWLIFLCYGAFLNRGIPFNTKALMVYIVVFSIYFIIYFLIFQKRFKKSNIKVNDPPVIK